jgi:predicted ATP-grasp superfamily ATP-dependent carboligase
MDKKTMVNKIKEAIKEWAHLHGPVSMVMLAYPDASSLDDKFSLLISAPWLDDQNPRQAIQEIFEKLKNHLEPDEFKCIARITPIKTTDRFVQETNAKYDVTQEKLEVSNFSASGMHFDLATILHP